jgi:hypothetical protein
LTEHGSAVADDFVKHFKNKLEDDKLDEIVAQLTADDTESYPAHGAVVSMIFYFQVQVDIDDTEDSFNGSGGGVSTPGGGALIGDVYTDDLDSLLANTVSFECNMTSVYTSVLFFDSDSNLLGNFEAGSVSTTNGIMGGTGSWSE